MTNSLIKNNGHLKLKSISKGTREFLTNSVIFQKYPEKYHLDQNKRSSKKSQKIIIYQFLIMEKVINTDNCMVCGVNLDENRNELTLVLNFSQKPVYSMIGKVLKNLNLFLLILASIF